MKEILIFQLFLSLNYKTMYQYMDRYNSNTMMGFTINGLCKSMDISYDNKTLLVGNKEGVKIVGINRNADYWFQHKMAFSKIKNQNHFSVSNLAWNKTSIGSDKYALGTLNKYLYVYNVNNPKYSTCRKCFEDDYIGILQWETYSANVMYATSQGNSYIAKFDDRQKDEPIIIEHINEEAETSQIVDFAYSPFDENYYAVLFDDNFSIFDKRKSFKKELYKLKDENTTFSAGNNFKKLEWDPKNRDRIAVANQNQIRIWKINEGGGGIVKNFIQPEIRIKDFIWRSKVQSQFFFTLSSQLQISGQKLSCNQQILQYDFSAPENQEFHSYFMSDFYDNKLGQWILDRNQQLLITSSKADNPDVMKKFGKQCHIILVQDVKNQMKPVPQHRQYRPLTFDCNSGLGTVLTETDKKKKEKKLRIFYFQQKQKSSIKINKKQLQKVQQKIKKGNRYFIPNNKNYLLSLKDEIRFFYKYYLREGPNAAIIERNKQVAKSLQSESKNMFCAPFWQMLFSFLYPKEAVHTLDSLFQDKIPVQLRFQQNNVFIYDKDKLQRKPYPYELHEKIQYIEEKIQFLADQNQLQTAVLVALILRAKDPTLINEKFLQNLLSPFLEILDRLQLFQIAAQIIMFSKLQRFTKQYNKNTHFRITCGRCSRNYGKCFCDEKCILCSKSLRDGYLMWCKICGHAGHARQYEEWFKKNEECPYGCTHKCFSIEP